MLAIVLWRSYGGSSLSAGALTVAARSLAERRADRSHSRRPRRRSTEHPSTAAILTLGVTVGTWIVNFVAAVQGGIWERAAGYTPTAMVSEFQHGLVRLDVVLIAATLILSGLALGAIWSRLGVAVARRLRRSVGARGASRRRPALSFTLVNTSWDTSENRGNSFSEADERALEGIRAPLAIEAHLAPEDPRRFDPGTSRALEAAPRHAKTSGPIRLERPRSGCSSRRRRTTARSGTTSVAGEPSAA